MPLEISINRVGEFIVNDEAEHPNQCGKVGARTYRYKVKITGDENGLDRQGFLVDNMVIYNYFANTYHNKKIKCESCETMACQAVKFLKEHCTQKGISWDIKKIHVELWGSDHSYITAETP